jgi:hypothetical protein
MIAQIKDVLRTYSLSILIGVGGFFALGLALQLFDINDILNIQTATPLAASQTTPQSTTQPTNVPPSPTATRTNAPAPTPTAANRFTSTPRPSNTPRPTSTPAPVPLFAIDDNVQARSCELIDCDVLVVLSLGDEILGLEEVEGQSVFGVTTWWRAMYEGQEIFVPASLLSETRPAQSSKNNDISPAQPQNVSPATDLPAASVSGCSCTGPDLDCGDFDTHAQAQACYDKCIAEIGRDVHRLDGNDNDSLACESLP